MPKIAKSAEELRRLVIAEAVQHPVCPENIDVLVRADAIYGWKADTIPPGAIGHPNCADHIGKIVMRLRRSYDLG
jgi:hypothetical protein